MQTKCIDFVLWMRVPYSGRFVTKMASYVVVFNVRRIICGIEEKSQLETLFVIFSKVVSQMAQWVTQLSAKISVFLKIYSEFNSIEAVF
jgi:hypothetical protein